MKYESILTVLHFSRYRSEFCTLGLKPGWVLNRVILKRKVDGDVITIASFLLLINCLGPECSSCYMYIQGQGNSTERCFIVT